MVTCCVGPAEELGLGVIVLPTLVVVCELLVGVIVLLGWTALVLALIVMLRVVLVSEVWKLEAAAIVVMGLVVVILSGELDIVVIFVMPVESVVVARELVPFEECVKLEPEEAVVGMDSGGPAVVVLE